MCLDGRIKETLRLVEEILSEQISGQREEIQVLSLMEEVTENIGYYQEVRQNREIETMYVGF